jgi:hypothetical protein
LEETVSLVVVKRVAQEKLKKHPSLVKRLVDEPDRLPLGSAAYTKLLMYWELVMAAWEEEGV